VTPRNASAQLFAGFLAAALAVPATAGAQAPPACASSSGAVIDAPRRIAYGRTGTVTVFASTTEAQGGVLTIRAADPARPITHPAAVSYSQMSSSGGNRRFRFRVADGDGDAVAAFEWTASENRNACRARVSTTIRTGRGARPFISIDHERSRRIVFGHERPECRETARVSWRVEVSGPGGRLSRSTSDICGQRFRRSGSNPGFTMRARRGAIVLDARRPRPVYRASYRVYVGGRLVVRGGLRAIVRRGRVIVVISIRRR
jgi:hypothetical protein